MLHKLGAKHFSKYNSKNTKDYFIIWPGDVLQVQKLSILSQIVSAIGQLGLHLYTLILKRKAHLGVQYVCQFYSIKIFEEKVQPVSQMTKVPTPLNARSDLQLPHPVFY